MKVVFTPTVNEISDILYSAGLVIRNIKEVRPQGTLEFWVDGTHVERIFELLRATCKIIEITSWTGATFCAIEQKIKHKWF